MSNSAVAPKNQGVEHTVPFTIDEVNWDELETEHLVGAINEELMEVVLKAMRLARSEQDKGEFMRLRWLFLTLVNIYDHECEHYMTEEDRRTVEASRRVRVG